MEKDGDKGVESAVTLKAKETMSEMNTRVEIRRWTISPYDLSSSDNPGSLISQLLLKGSNYSEWSGNLKMALRARKKFGFVHGTIPKPSKDSGDLEDWWTNNALVMSWIRLTISEVFNQHSLISMWQVSIGIIYMPVLREEWTESSENQN